MPAGNTHTELPGVVRNRGWVVYSAEGETVGAFSIRPWKVKGGGGGGTMGEKGKGKRMEEGGRGKEKGKVEKEKEVRKEVRKEVNINIILEVSLEVVNDAIIMRL